MLRRCVSRLSKDKLCSKIYSPLHLHRVIPSITYTNIRLIQSIAFHNNINSKSTISPFTSSYHHNQSHQSLQYFNHRDFSLPPHEIVGLPALSPSVEESKIVQWKKNEGDLVEEDEAIASVQTDKAELDWLVTDDVYLAKILLKPDQTVPIGTPTCIFVEEKSMVDAFKNYDISQSTSQLSSTPEPPKQEPSKPADTSKPTPTPTNKPATQLNYPEHQVEGMPALSPTAIDGAVVEWLVKEGDRIEEGSGIAEIQTDKSVVTWTSTDEVYVAKLLVSVSADDRLPVGTPLAVFVENQTDVAAFVNYSVSDAIVDTPSPTSSTSTSISTPEEEPTGRTPSIEFRYGTRDAPSTTPDRTASSASDRIIASPYAKKIAKEMGISLDTVGSGSGPKGRIVANDVYAAKDKPVATQPVTPQPVRITGDRTYEDIPVSVMREIIGQRLSQSKFSAPHFYCTVECIMDNLVSLRTQMNEGDGVNKISVNDFIIKACGMALQDQPDVNAGWITKDGSKPVIRKYNYIDISVAVATPSGLITPIIKDVNKKTLSEISLEMKDLGRRAKENKLLPEEFQGGTFTVSNLGMFGINNFTAIINPPQSCILAVGGTKKVLKPDDKNVNGFVTNAVMEVTLSSDHRSVDGALAAIWCNEFQKYIQKPAKMLI